MEVNVKVSKESWELGQGVARFIGTCVKASQDGWSYGDDIPTIVSSAISNLLPALDGISSIASELENDQEAFYNTVSLIGVEVLKSAGVIKSGISSNK